MKHFVVKATLTTPPPPHPFPQSLHHHIESYNMAYTKAYRVHISLYQSILMNEPMIARHETDVDAVIRKLLYHSPIEQVNRTVSGSALANMSAAIIQ